MNENIKFTTDGLLVLKVQADTAKEHFRVFIPSTKINVFPCSRRGQISTNGSALNCDPEARLNTERTNRLRTAINGFTDSFIVNSTFTAGDTMTFALAGYRVEIRNFNPEDIASALREATGNEPSAISAHLSLHDEISLGVSDYFTEILYRQSSDSVDHNYIDVEYTYNSAKSYYFMGVSFIADVDKTKAKDTVLVKTAENTTATKELSAANLLLFTKSENDWKLSQESLLPNVRHGSTNDSIVVLGDATFNTTLSASQASINALTVPYNKQVVGDFDNTTINNNGIEASYIKAKSIAADGLAVGNEISIVNPADTAEKTIIGLNINTAGNINVGNPASPAVVSKGGCIVAKNDITAERDLIAKNDVNVTKNLTVAEQTKTDTLEVAKTATINKVLNVTKAEGTSDPAVATIDNAVIDNAEINESLAVGTDKFSVTAAAANFTVPVNVNNNVTIDGENCYIKTPALDVKTIKNDGTEAVTVDDDLTVKGNLVLDAGKAVTTDTLNVNSLTSDSDKIEINKPINVTGKATLKNGLEVTNGETILKKLTADTIIQNGNQVPVITLEQISTGEPEIWQLQIDHVIKKT
jgi:hypothetical protein